MTTATPAKPKPAKGTAAKPKADAPEKGSATNAKPARTFPADVSAAVKMARTEWHAKRPGMKPDTRAAAASGGDHTAVRATLAEIIEGDMTPDKVLATTGLSLPKLIEVAKFTPGTDTDLATLRESVIGKACAKSESNRAWRTGRYLAGIVAAHVTQMRAAAKA